MDQRSRFRASFNRVRPTADQTQPAHTQQPVEHPHTTHQQTHHSETHTKSPKKLGLFFGRKWLLIVIAVLVVVLAVLAVGYIHTKNQLNAAKNPEIAGKTEAEKIINQVSPSVELPSGETPTLATVNDVAKLKNQAFFKNAQNGDKVLVYTKAGKAVLYRPSTKKVIIYSFVNTNNPQ